MIYARLYQLPERMEILENLDIATRAPMSSMQLWCIDDCPVIIEKDGSSKIYHHDEWHSSFDTWELISEGLPLSFLMFDARWPGVVDKDTYLASFE